MKFIEDIRDRHKGEEIWVVGAGSSLDDYPIDFFDGKICIGVNYVFSVFLDIGDGIEKFNARAFYSVHEHRVPADWIVKHIPDFLDHCFFLLPPARRPSDHHMIWWEDYNDDPYYMRWGLKGKAAVSATDQDFADVAKCIMEKGECHYVCRGTTLHWAVQAAVVLGAKKIYVVGEDGQGDHMYKHGSMYKQMAKHKYKHPYWREATRCMARVFKLYGVEIAHHHYSQGEQE